MHISLHLHSYAKASKIHKQLEIKKIASCTICKYWTLIVWFCFKSFNKCTELPDSAAWCQTSGHPSYECVGNFTQTVWTELAE